MRTVSPANFAVTNGVPSVDGHLTPAAKRRKKRRKSNKKKSVPKVVPLVKVVLPTMFAFDARLFALAYNNLEPLEFLWRFLSLLGHGLWLSLIVIPLLLIIEGRHATRTILWIVTGTLVSGILVTALKYAVDLPRPVARAEIQALIDRDRLPQVPRERSFPSGHSQTAFAVGSFLALRYRRALGFILVLACSVAIARIGLGLHTPLDVICGAVLGTLGGVMAYWKSEACSPV